MKIRKSKGERACECRSERLYLREKGDAHEKTQYHAVQSLVNLYGDVPALILRLGRNCSVLLGRGRRRVGGGSVERNRGMNLRGYGREDSIHGMACRVVFKGDARISPRCAASRVNYPMVDNRYRRRLLLISMRSPASISRVHVTRTRSFYMQSSCHRRTISYFS